MCVRARVCVRVCVCMYMRGVICIVSGKVLFEGGCWAYRVDHDAGGGQGVLRRRDLGLSAWTGCSAIRRGSPGYR